TNGMVLVAAGADISGNPTASAELYNPATGSWSVTGSLNAARELHSATLLANGMVLAVRGFDSNFDVSPSAELYNAPAPAPTPQYQIYDIGVVDVGDTFSQGFGVSPEGIAVGRSIRNDGSHAFSWTLNGGIVGLPDLAGRSYCVSNSANDSGGVVGTGATT